MAKLGTRKNIQIDNDILEWLDKEYEGMSIWWLVNTLLRNFMNLHSSLGSNRIKRLARIAAKQTLEGDLK
jgi:hypothetical protein